MFLGFGGRLSPVKTPLWTFGYNSVEGFLCEVNGLVTHTQKIGFFNWDGLGSLLFAYKFVG